MCHHCIRSLGFGYDNEGCDLCGTRFTGEWGVPSLKTIGIIDHDHSTGKVRGKLCQGCNTALGKLERRGHLKGLCPDFERQMKEYLGIREAPEDAEMEAKDLANTKASKK